jgi:hypothetical protein
MSGNARAERERVELPLWSLFFVDDGASGDRTRKLFMFIPYTIFSHLADNPKRERVCLDASRPPQSQSSRSRRVRFCVFV